MEFVAHAVVNQQNALSQNLITSKSRLRKGLFLPHLELVAVHMSANLAENVKTCLNKLRKEKYMCGQMALQFYTG